MKSGLPVLLMALILCSNADAITQAAASNDGGSASAAATPSGPQQPRAPTPLATAEGTVDGVRVEVTELKRGSGGTVSLRFAIVNASSRPLQVSDVGIASGALITPVDGAAYTIGGVHLIDLAGKKKHFVARDSEVACLCSQFGAIKPGGRANHWARFSAPPDGVERLTVVIPPFAPMEDVSLSR